MRARASSTGPSAPSLDVKRNVRTGRGAGRGQCDGMSEPMHAPTVKYDEPVETRYAQSNAAEVEALEDEGLKRGERRERVPELRREERLH